MNSASWFLLLAGSAVTTLAVMLFLFTLWLGLHRNKWWPLIIVTAAWLLAMTVYALVDSSNFEGSPRQRIGQQAQGPHLMDFG